MTFEVIDPVILIKKVDRRYSWLVLHIEVLILLIYVDDDLVDNY